MQQARKCNKFCVQYRYMGSGGGTPLGQREGGGVNSLNPSTPLPPPIMGLYVLPYFWQFVWLNCHLYP